MMYGFPAVDGPEGGLKTATEQYDPPSILTASTAQSLMRMWPLCTPNTSGRDFPMFPAACCAPRPASIRSRRDAKFVVDKFPVADNILFASACSGHGFKHSAALGEALALQATGQPLPIDLAAFSLNRF